MIVLYNILLSIVFFLALPLIPLLMLISDKRRHTVPKRLFMPAHDNGRCRSESCCRPIWVHALSVGETLSAIPFVKSLCSTFGKDKIIFTASTKTGYEIARKEMRKHVRTVCYFPFDFLFSVKRALNIIDPDRVIIVETDLWPNFLFELKKRRLPVYLVNARLSVRSFKGYRRLKGFVGRMMTSFHGIFAQTDKDAGRFEKLGAAPGIVKSVGNFKFDHDHHGIDDKQVSDLKKRFHISLKRKVIIIGSTHSGEEKIMAHALGRLRTDGLNPMIIAVPRNPDRADEVCRIFNASGFASIKMSETGSCRESESCDVLVIDAIGYLAKLYAVADVAFIGGSLVKRGGHNPLEPAALAKPVIFGRHMEDFEEIAFILTERKGAVFVSNEKEMAHAVKKLLSDESYAKKMGENAVSVFKENQGAIDKTLAYIFRN